MIYAIVNLLGVAVLIGIDRVIKIWAEQVLQPLGAIPLIPHVVELRFVYNQGMAFSLLSGKRMFLVVATSIMLILVAYWLFFRCKNNQLTRIALILVLGGGIGNLIDRAVSGQVVDYINLLFMRFAIFNFADIVLCIGAGLWALSIILEEYHSESEKSPKEN